MSQQWLLMDSERASWVMPQHLKDFKVKVNRSEEERGREREREGERKREREGERENLFISVQCLQELHCLDKFNKATTAITL